MCWNCQTEIRLVKPPYCLLCGDPAYGELPQAYFCPACGKQKPFFDCARSAAVYTGLIKEMILDFKYRGAVWLGPDLGQLMSACLRTHFNAPAIDRVTYVPLHKTRERERTYNQSFLLANEIAGQLNRKAFDYLERMSATTSQTHLTSAERADNVRNKFAVKKRHDLKGQRILLVDDVMTTGATVNECARVLKSAGAREVLVLTAARG
jgi:ComF family protein